MTEPQTADNGSSATEYLAGNAIELQSVQPSDALQRAIANSEAQNNNTTTTPSVTARNTAQGQSRGRVWYAPWTWWRRQGTASQKKTQNNTEEIHGEINNNSASNAQSTSTVSSTKGKSTPRPLLPEVHMGPLAEEQVAQLTRNVRTARQRVLDDEEEIHKVLTNIEQARYRYMIVRPELPCQDAVQRVTQCYEACNERHHVKDSNDGGVWMSDEAHMAYTKDLLACADVVQALRACTDEQLRVYCEGDNTARN